MVRVNLLPREVVNRRRFEQWYRFVFIGVVGLALIVLFAYAGLLLMSQQKTDTLQSLREQTTKFQAQADAFSVFEARQQELNSRELVAQTALAGRISMGMLAEEVSLVLPDEVWLETITLSEASGLSLTGNTPRSASESVDVAYKSIAKLLVRLNELPSLNDVWLMSATNSEWSRWSVAEGGATPLPARIVGFTATGKVVMPVAPAATATGTAAPAPATGN